MSNKKVGAVLVVGGGIGGIQASLDLAESGYKVYLIEDKPSIGGRMAQLDKTFPTNDCSMCIMAPKLVDCGRHPNIEIITRAELEKIEGEAGNFKVKIKKHPTYVDQSKCTGCGSCEQECPVKFKIIEPEPREVKLDPNVKKKMEEIMARHIGEKGGLVSILHDINSTFTYLPEECLKYLALEMKIPLSIIFHIATFYHAFRLTPVGKYLITVCMGTTCHVKGAPKNIEAFERELGIKINETTPDRLFTLGEALCLGCCGLAPVVKINDDFFGGVTTSDIPKIIKDYRAKEASYAKT